jgi:hypothetical protein
MLDDIDLDIPEEEPQRPPPSSNRAFLVVAGVLGAIMILAIIGMAIYALVILPRQQAAEEAEAPSSLQLTSTELAKALQATATPTLSPTLTAIPSDTPTPTLTPTDTIAPTETPSETPVTPIFTSSAEASATAGASATTDSAGATGTVEAVLTNAAAAATSAALGTPTATSSALPDTGFGDTVGFPGLALATALLIAVILLTRSLRASYE